MSNRPAFVGRLSNAPSSKCSSKRVRRRLVFNRPSIDLRHPARLHRPCKFLLRTHVSCGAFPVDLGGVPHEGLEELSEAGADFGWGTEGDDIAGVVGDEF